MHKILLRSSKRYRLMRFIKKIPNLVSYYPQNEVEGIICRNYAPANSGSLNGTISGGVTLSAVGSRIGRCYTFNGTDGQIDLGTSALMAFATSDFTFGTICFLKNSTTVKMPIATRSGINDGYEIRINDSVAGRCVINVDGSGSGAASGGNFNTTVDTFHFLAGVVNRTTATVRTFGDGLFRGSSSISSIGNITNSQNPFLAKRGVTFFDERSQHSFIVARALSETELARLSHLAGFN